ncbi:MAG: hypothetical protein CMJ81_15200 [Planctomycetaceae bacterium]|nr:hypothetical protein [Planctomycetaceae bacterium]MBP62072.1 hypothetical protein [Planctomycetaceae bacterium]
MVFLSVDFPLRVAVHFQNCFGLGKVGFFWRQVAKQSLVLRFLWPVAYGLRANGSLISTND